MKVIGTVPFQVPVDTDSVRPSRGVPEMAGATVFCGTIPATIAVGPEVAATPPASLVARTRTRTVRPISAAESLYVVAVAPAMSVQVLPAESQRSHW